MKNSEKRKKNAKWLLNNCKCKCNIILLIFFLNLQTNEMCEWGWMICEKIPDLCIIIHCLFEMNNKMIPIVNPFVFEFYKIGDTPNIC